MSQLRFNLFSLKKRLELLQGRDIPWLEVAEESGLNRNTVDSLANNKARGIRLETMSKLISYFRENGLSINVEDLFVEEESQSLKVKE